MGLRQFCRDLALLPEMWRIAVEDARDRAALDHIVWDLLSRDPAALEATMKLPDRLRTMPAVRNAVVLGLHFGNLRLQNDGHAQ